MIIAKEKDLFIQKQTDNILAPIDTSDVEDVCINIMAGGEVLMISTTIDGFWAGAQTEGVEGANIRMERSSVINCRGNAVKSSNPRLLKVNECVF